MVIGFNQYSRADTGFPAGGDANCPGKGGRQHTKLPNFPKNCMKLRNFRVVGEGAPIAPL